MKKSRSLVLALAMSVAAGGLAAGLPADAAEPTLASVRVTAAPDTLAAAWPDTVTVAEAPVDDAFDVVGSGWWRRAWEVTKCVGRGILFGMNNNARGTVEFVTCYVNI